MTFALLQDLRDSSPPTAAAASAHADRASFTAWSGPAQQLSGSPAAASVASASNAGEGGGLPAGVGDGDRAAAPPEAAGAAEERPGATLSRYGFDVVCCMLHVRFWMLYFSGGTINL